MGAIESDSGTGVRRGGGWLSTGERPAVARGRTPIVEGMSPAQHRATQRDTAQGPAVLQGRALQRHAAPGPMTAALAIVAGQYGALTCVQARGCGLATNDLRQLLRLGEWLHPHRQIYVVCSLVPETYGPERLRCVFIAAQLALGSCACSAGRTAARLWRDAGTGVVGRARGPHGRPGPEGPVVPGRGMRCAVSASLRPNVKNLSDSPCRMIGHWLRRVEALNRVESVSNA